VSDTAAFEPTVTNLFLGSCVQRFLCMRGQKSTHVPKKVGTSLEIGSTRRGSNFERVQAELVEVVQVKRRLVQKKRKSQIGISISPSVAFLSTALWFPTGAVV
jgi:hypothetical protein